MSFTPRIGTFVRAVAVAAAVLCSLFSGNATAQSLRTSAGQHWTVLASSKDVDTAIGIARYYGSSARVVLSNNGWYAAVLKPQSGSLSDIRKAMTWRTLPEDTFLSNGRGFGAMVWRPPHSDVVQAQLTSASPAVLSRGGLTVTIRRFLKGDGWEAELSGTLNGAHAFSFNYDFPQALDFPSKVTLVHLDKNNAQPDIIFDAFTGGAHCCTRVAAVTKDSTGQWKIVDLGEYDGSGPWFEDAGGDGAVEIVHGDNTFLYKFSSYAESIQPLAIDVLEDGTLKDVSADPAYRRRVIQHLRELEFLAKMDPGLWHSNGFLAAWVADKFLVGEGPDAWTKMLPLYARDAEFNVIICTVDLPQNSCPSADQKKLSFPDGLRRVLEAAGYLPGSPEAAPSPTASAAETPSATTPVAVSPEIPKTSTPETGTISGTGFFVATKMLLTNAHVVEGCNRVHTSVRGVKLSASVVARDEANDLALVQTSQPGTAVANLREGARLGEDIAAFGFPLSGILASSGNFTRGSITAAAGLRDDTRYYQISAPVQPGNSGGPLLDRYGNVVGIVVAKIDAIRLATLTDDIAQNVNFAIKASIAESFMDANGIQPVTNSWDKPLAPEDLAAKAQSFSVAVECRPTSN